jgi:hypothetical protein
MKLSRFRSPTFRRPAASRIVPGLLRDSAVPKRTNEQELTLVLRRKYSTGDLESRATCEQLGQLSKRSPRTDADEQCGFFGITPAGSKNSSRELRPVGNMTPNRRVVGRNYTVMVLPLLNALTTYTFYWTSRLNSWPLNCHHLTKGVLD